MNAGWPGLFYISKVSCSLVRADQSQALRGYILLYYGPVLKEAGQQIPREDGGLGGWILGRGCGESLGSMVVKGFPFFSPLFFIHFILLDIHQDFPDCFEDN